MQTWIVTADSDTSLAILAKQLEAIGLTIVRVLDVIAVVEVQGSEALAHRARELPGVASVEKSLVFDINPPESR